MIWQEPSPEVVTALATYENRKADPAIRLSAISILLKLALEDRLKPGYHGFTVMNGLLYPPQPPYDRTIRDAALDAGEKFATTWFTGRAWIACLV
jgi:hypothetical protein